MEAGGYSEPPGRLERRLVRAIVAGAWWRHKRGGPWRVPDWLPHERATLDGNVGARLAARWFPSTDPRGTVVLAHPDLRYGQHWFVHAGWVDFLHDRRFNVATVDLAGYGESLGGARYHSEDVSAAVEWARSRAPAQPLHVVGVSMGAFAAANAAPDLAGVSSLLLESPYPSINEWYGRGWRRAAMGAMDRLFPRSSAMLRADRRLAAAPAPRVLVVAAARDTVTPPALSRAVAEAGPRGRTRYAEFPGGHLEPFATSPDYRRTVESWLMQDPAHGGPPAVAARIPQAAAGARIHQRDPRPTRTAL